MATKRLMIESEEQLRRLYMPFIKSGALFYPTEDTHQLGDEMKLVVRLPRDNEDTLVRCKVVWLAPQKSGRLEQRGVGLQFIDDKAHLRNRIETLLGHLGESALPTATM